MSRKFKIGDLIVDSNGERYLREFAEPKPPKPEEPIGLGAVVEDANGDTWVRVGSDGVWAASTPDRVATQWDAIDAVRVLSDGVTP